MNPQRIDTPGAGAHPPLLDCLNKEITVGASVVHPVNRSGDLGRFEVTALERLDTLWRVRLHRAGVVSTLARSSSVCVVESKP